MKTDKLMTRDVRTCRPDDRLTEPARIMWENDCGCVPVVDAQLRVLGMITDRDICMAAYTQGRRLEDIHVQIVMSKSVHCCRSDDDVSAAEELMRTQKLHRLPVVDDSRRLVGLLSLNDLACRAAIEQGQKDKQVSLEEVGRTLAAVCAHGPSTLGKAVVQPAKRPVLASGSRVSP